MRSLRGSRIRCTVLVSCCTRPIQDRTVACTLELHGIPSAQPRRRPGWSRKAADPESGKIRPDGEKIGLANHTSPGEEILKRRNKPLQFNPLQTAQMPLSNYMVT